MRYRKVAVVTSILTVIALSGTGTALAYWNTSGTGTGTATVAQVKPLVISQVPVTDLLPGKPVELAGTIENLNGFDASLAQQALIVVPAIDSKHSACDVTTNFVVATPLIRDAVAKANGAATFSGGSVTLLDLPKVDQQACIGATITFAYSLTGATQ